MRTATYITAVIGLLSIVGCGSEPAMDYWQQGARISSYDSTSIHFPVSTYREVEFDQEAMRQQLDRAPGMFESLSFVQTDVDTLTIALPLADSTTQKFKVWEAPVMQNDLQQRYAHIKTYAGQGIDNRTATVRFEVHDSLGLSGMIISNMGTSFIEPIEPTAKKYMCFYKENFVHKKMLFEFGFDDLPDIISPIDLQLPDRLPDEKVEARIFRLALAGTIRYTDYFPSKEMAFFNMVKAVNRLSQIYERELAVSFRLVNDNDLLLFDDDKHDVYAGLKPDDLLDRNQLVIDSIINVDNYDIGHVFDTGNTGLASVGVLCDNASKAEGLTGSSEPTGPQFFVDYFAHEIGHQFGANHTFRSFDSRCMKHENPETAVEPGSGSTLMAYAKLCSLDNIQHYSDPYFHHISLAQMLSQLKSLSVGCGEVETTANYYPQLTIDQKIYHIPEETGVVLSAQGEDLNTNDLLTYSFEQYDLSGQQFRSYLYDTTDYQFMPDIDKLINDNFNWVRDRSINFRVTVRDNCSFYGGVNAKSIRLNIENDGPFEINSPGRGGVWNSGTQVQIIWDVAKTNLLPIDCHFVRILLSIDGGKRFDITIAEEAENIGKYEFFLNPGLQSTEAVVYIEAVDNLFFAVSSPFQIIPGPGA